MTNKKMTKREMFAQIKANYPLTQAEVAFIDHEIELLEKKNSGEHKPTAKQTENESVKSAIYDEMENGARYTISEMIKALPSCAELTNQRVSALVRQMIADGKVSRTEEKRKAYFSKI